MILSINKPSARKFFIPVVIAFAMVLCCFKSDRRMDASEAVTYSNHCLNQSYDASGESKLKKWEMSVTEDLFVRLRKTYIGGKQDYFSFRIKRFNDLSYIGTATAGTILLKTDADNVIQQTYNDPKGNEDNMVQTMSIPVKNMEPERVDSLRTALLFLRNGR
ncbi:MAG: hypothetical protein ABIN91_01685 [Mucilaginibacter sp.]|uniref:hypothetical protein n=1 Tax=Mucilaginibacter sp. TaxID=1882438 RepID=UPI003267F7F2